MRISEQEPSSRARRVVVTGASIACALGFEVDDFWSRLLEGRCGISRLPNIPDDSPLPVKIAGRIDDGQLDAALRRYGLHDPDRPNQLALYIVGRALEEAGLSTADAPRPVDIDLIFGSGHGNVGLTNEGARIFHADGYRKMRPTLVVRSMFNRPANIASIRYQLTGTSYVVSCACASGSIAFGEAFRRVRWGETDLAVAACSDSGLDLPTFAAWNRLGVMTHHPDPKTASRPFDRKRDGLVMGEGAAGFVLETLESAQARGARLWAEVLAFASTCDAKHIVRPDSAGQIKAVNKALAAAALAPADIDYVNAHGTATELADIAEAATIRAVFGHHADRVPVSNTKAQLGHLMGATAGVELVTTLCALRHGVIPPNRNLDEPDPRCPLRFVRDTPLKTPLTHALKNSFAFGGTNCAILLKRA